MTKKQSKMPNIGKYIQDARHRKGLTQEKLAELSEISVSTLVNIETDRRKPSIEKLYILMKALDMSFDKLVFGNEIDNDGEKEALINQIRVSGSKDAIFLQSVMNAVKERDAYEHS